MISAGADIEANNVVKRTPLHYAVARGHVTTTELLLRAGADVTATQNGKLSALHLAVLANSEGIVRMILRHHDFANIAATDACGLSALGYAAIKRSIPIVRMLIEVAMAMGMGMSMSYIETSAVSQTALQCAVLCGHRDVIDELLNGGMDINCVNNIGQTCLFAATRSAEAHPDLMHYLISRGANVMATDVHGQTALHVVATYDRPDHYYNPLHRLRISPPQC